MYSVIKCAITIPTRQHANQEWRWCWKFKQIRDCLSTCLYASALAAWIWHSFRMQINPVAGDQSLKQEHIHPGYQGCSAWIFTSIPVLISTDLANGNSSWPCSCTTSSNFICFLWHLGSMQEAFPCPPPLLPCLWMLKFLAGSLCSVTGLPTGLMGFLQAPQQRNYFLSCFLRGDNPTRLPKSSWRSERQTAR